MTRLTGCLGLGLGAGSKPHAPAIASVRVVGSNIGPIILYPHCEGILLGSGERHAPWCQAPFAITYAVLATMPSSGPIAPHPLPGTQSIMAARDPSDAAWLTPARTRRSGLLTDRP